MGKHKGVARKYDSPLPIFQNTINDALERIGTILKILFDTADDAILLMDGLHFIDCNLATLRVFGCDSKEQIIGQTPIAFSPPNQPVGRPSIDQAKQYKKGVLEGVPQYFEWQYWKLDHTPFDVEVKLNRCFLGGKAFIVAVVRDITVRKRVENERKEVPERLLQEKQFSNRLIECLPGIFYLYSSNLQLVRWNKNHETAFDYTVGELERKPIGYFCSTEEESKSAIDFAHKILSDLEQGPKEFDTIDKSGKHACYLYSGVRFNSSSGPMLMGVGVDITERKLAEMERDRLMKELEAASSAKDKLLAVISHELRNPLAAIQAGVGLLKAKKLDESRYLRVLTAIERSVNLQARLISDLLDLSQIARGSFSIQPRCVQISDFLMPAMQSCFAEGNQSGVTLLEEGEINSWVKVDSARIQQALIHLVENGIKASAQGGLVRVTASTRPPVAVLTVEDNGIGIEPELLREIFEKFRQGELGGKRFSGLGIGLSIVKSIIDLHGGHIRVESDGPGRGSRVIIELPLCEPPHEWGDSESYTRNNERYKLLLVEDIDDTRECFAESLAQQGYEVISAESGEKALEIVDRQSFDVILADIGLPGMDGYEFLRQVRRSPKKSYSVAFALTGYGQEKDVLKSRDADFSGHFVKPLSVDEIDRGIRLQLRKRRLPRE